MSSSTSKFCPITSISPFQPAGLEETPVSHRPPLSKPCSPFAHPPPQSPGCHDEDHHHHHLDDHHHHHHLDDHDHHLSPGLPGRLSLSGHSSLQLHRQPHILHLLYDDGYDCDDGENDYHDDDEISFYLNTFYFDTPGISCLVQSALWGTF